MRYSVNTYNPETDTAPRELKGFEKVGDAIRYLDRLPKEKRSRSYLVVNGGGIIKERAA